MFTRSRLILRTVVVVLLLVVSSCTTKKNETLDKVSLRLKWIITPIHATGELVAVEKGFFRQNNIDCAIEQGGTGINSIQLVAGGSDDFGVTGGDQLILARAEGVPLTAIAVLHQESPVCLFSKKGSGIKEPKDLLGHKLGMKFGTNVETEYRMMMKNLGLDMSKVEEIPAGYDITPFLEGKVDVWSGYVANEPLQAEAKGCSVNVIAPRDYGVHFYSNTYFATEKTISERTGLVQRFLDAALRGWNYALEHPEEAIDIYLKHTEQQNRSEALESLKMIKPLMLTDANKDYGVGMMERSRWQEMINELSADGILKKDVRVDDLFTKKFLK